MLHIAHSNPPSIPNVNTAAAGSAEDLKNSQSKGTLKGSDILESSSHHISVIHIFS